MTFQHFTVNWSRIGTSYNAFSFQLYQTPCLSRLYCYAPENKERLAAIYVLVQLLDQITLVSAPILPHLMEEIELHHPWRQGIKQFASS